MWMLMVLTVFGCRSPAVRSTSSTAAAASPALSSPSLVFTTATYVSTYSISVVPQTMANGMRNTQEPGILININVSTPFPPLTKLT